MKGFMRRKFLMVSVVSAVSFLSCKRLFATDIDSVSKESHYYLKNRVALTTAFRQVLEGVSAFLEPEFGKEATKKILADALKRFEKLVSYLPDVGGEKNWDAQYLPIAAWCVALYEPLKECGKSAEYVGRLLYDLRKYELTNTPAQLLKKEGEAFFTAEAREKMRKWAAWTQKREYPANWVARFIEGEGTAFDFGYDYSECAIVKYFSSQGVSELAPYFCLNDFTQSQALGTGLRRSKTIAQGDGVCNFRYKKGRQVTQNWDTEIALIRVRMAQTS